MQVPRLEIHKICIAKKKMKHKILLFWLWIFNSTFSVTSYCLYNEDE